MSKEQAITLTTNAFDIIIQYLEHLDSNPELLLSQPFLHLPPLTYSQVSNETTALNLMIAIVREIHYHTGQIIYIAKMRKGQLLQSHIQNRKRVPLLVNWLTLVHLEPHMLIKTFYKRILLVNCYLCHLVVSNEVLHDLLTNTFAT